MRIPLLLQQLGDVSGGQCITQFCYKLHEGMLVHLQGEWVNVSLIRHGTEVLCKCTE